MNFVRPHFRVVAARLAEPVRFIQILAGPRQVGKTTLIKQILASRYEGTFTFLAADQQGAESPDWANPSSSGLPVRAEIDAQWLQRHWLAARALAERERGSNTPHLLIVDEVQKIPNWSEVVKGLWDADRGRGTPLHVVLLGSSPLLVQRGLTESLAGRFELIPMRHWSLAEMQEAFGMTLEQYIYFGGYPGAAPFLRDEERWARYVLASLIQPTIERDVLMMAKVEKPSLLKRLFEIGSAYSGQILAYTKMQGQLQDAGNTTTLAHYLQLLEQSGLVSGLQKYAGQVARQRASSPKLNVQNTALMSAGSGYSFAQARADRAFWGRLVESCIGAHLINSAHQGCSIMYWRESPHEVDFILSTGQRLTAIEVKSGKSTGHTPGLQRFAEAFRHARTLVVGDAPGCEVSLAEFLSQPASYWHGSGQASDPD